MLYCKADGSQRKVYTRMFVSVFPSAWTVMAETVSGLFGTTLSTTVVKKVLISQLMNTQNMTTMP